MSHFWLYVSSYAQENPGSSSNKKESTNFDISSVKSIYFHPFFFLEVQKKVSHLIVQFNDYFRIKYINSC